MMRISINGHNRSIEAPPQSAQKRAFQGLPDFKMNMTKFDDALLYPLLMDGNLEKIGAFLKEFGVDSVDRDQRTFLMSAVTERNDRVARYLVELGCDVNAKDGEGLTALHFAALGGDEHIAEFLIANGANVDAVDKRGNTALWRAAMEHKRESAIVKLLLNKGADSEKANRRGVRPSDLLGES